MSIFDGDWHCYMESPTSFPVLELQGGLRLKVDQDGKLSDSHIGTNPILGQVDDSLKSIVFVEDAPNEGKFTYRGKVVFDDIVNGQSRIVACGKFVLQTLQPEQAEGQEEGTWVITKP